MMEKSRERVPELWVLMELASPEDARRFLAQDGTVTDEVEQARQFHTEAEALDEVGEGFEPRLLSEFLPPIS